MVDHCYSLVPVEKLCVQIIYHSIHLKTISDKKKVVIVKFLFIDVFLKQKNSDKITL